MNTLQTLQQKSGIKDKKNYFVLIKGSLHQADISFKFVCT